MGSLISNLALQDPDLAPPHASCRADPEISHICKITIYYLPHSSHISTTRITDITSPLTSSISAQEIWSQQARESASTAWKCLSFMIPKWRSGYVADNDSRTPISLSHQIVTKIGCCGISCIPPAAMECLIEL